MAEYEVKPLDGNPFEILKFIYRYKLEHEYSPSNREIVEAIRTRKGASLSLSVLHYHLGRLKHKYGYINFLRRQSRTVHLTPAGKAFIKAHLLPDRIAALKKQKTEP